MKIIKIGDINFRFICPECGTEFEIESEELKKDESSSCYKDDSSGYYIKCPLCDRILMLYNDNKVVEYYKRRKELKNEK